MNTSQKRVLTLGILVLVAICAVPPWIAKFPAVQVTSKLLLPADSRAIGYAPIWNVPRPRFTDLPLTQNVFDLLYQPAKAREQFESDQRERASPATTQWSDSAWSDAVQVSRVESEELQQAQKQGLVKSYDEWWLMRRSPYADILAQHVPLEVTLDVGRLVLSCAITALLCAALFVICAKTKP